MGILKKKSGNLGAPNPQDFPYPLDKQGNANHLGPGAHSPQIPTRAVGNSYRLSKNCRKGLPVIVRLARDNRTRDNGIKGLGTTPGANPVGNQPAL